VARAREVAPLVCLVTFSYRMRHEQTPEQQRRAASSALYYMPFMDVERLFAGYEEYNRVVREVAHETGAILVEDELSIPGDGRHFSDSVHFLDPGSRQQAERVLAGLRAAPAWRAWIEARRSP